MRDPTTSVGSPHLSFLLATRYLASCPRTHPVIADVLLHFKPAKAGVQPARGCGVKITRISSGPGASPKAGVNVSYCEPTCSAHLWEMATVMFVPVCLVCTSKKPRATVVRGKLAAAELLKLKNNGPRIFSRWRLTIARFQIGASVATRRNMFTILGGQKNVRHTGEITRKEQQDENETSGFISVGRDDRNINGNHFGVSRTTEGAFKLEQ